MNRILLIDGDVLAYRASCAVEVATEWEPGYWTWHCDENEVKTAITAEIDRYMAKLEGHSYKVCLTDTVNFRKDVLPTYKHQRANVRKPLVLKPVRAWLLDELKAVMRPRLEGDDVLGILATWPGLAGEKIVVSIDKDMKTIPCLYARNLEEGVVEVSEPEANYWHLFQTLTGDTTDGYSGCPGVGAKGAEKIIGTVEDARGRDTLVADCWPLIIAAYENKKLGATEALVQARVARILRASDFNFKTKEPVLWKPPQH